MHPDWDAVRREFPALEHWTYLNTATFGQLPRRATAAVAKHFEHRDELACGDFLAWYDDADRLRAKLGRLINCAASDIAFVPNASTALGILLSGLDWRSGRSSAYARARIPEQSVCAGLARALRCGDDRLSVGAPIRFGGRTDAPGDRELGELQHRVRAAPRAAC